MGSSAAPSTISSKSASVRRQDGLLRRSWILSDYYYEARTIQENQDDYHPGCCH
jgi:hypothetical protein